MEDYFKEMEMLMERLEIDEDEENTMARFLHGLDIDATERVELQVYTNIEELVHLAMEVEKQLQRRKSRYTSKNVSNSTFWK